MPSLSNSMNVRVRQSNMVDRSQAPIEDYDERRKTFDGNIMISLPATGECPFCDWKCKSMKGSTWAMHMSRKHTIELGRAVDPYKCSQCEKKFCSRSHLNHHVANHHEVILQNCPDKDCCYQGKNRASVVTHYMRKHMKEIIERCEAVDGCVSCDRSGVVSVYHMGVCNPCSPFSK
jgi:hypothetical protein